MNPTTLDEALQRLAADYAFKKHRNGKWLQEGVCPQCRQKELYASAEAPWIIKCGRTNNCGWENSLRELYPDLFSTWSNRFEQTQETPNAAADAYLREARGFDLFKLKGLYSQEYFFHRELQQGSATVRFPMADGYWERLIDQPERFDRKAHIKKGWSANGSWWCPPGVDLLNAKDIWLVEGIFDAIALWLNGVIAVATISSNYYPSNALSALAAQCKANDRTRPRLVWAMDNDTAGHKAIEKWFARSQAEGWTCAAAQAVRRSDGKSQDWNDLHLVDKLSPKDLTKYRYYGDLLTAQTASEKALLMYKHTERAEFAFDFRNRLYWFKLDLEAYNKKANDLRIDEETEQEKIDALRDEALSTSGIISELANCRPTPLYYLANVLTDESWYYFRIDFPLGGEPVKNTFTGAQLSSGAEFKKRLLAIAPGVIYTGSSQQLDRFLRYQIDNIKRVQTVDFIGYCRDHKAWIFNDLAVKDGKTYKLNNEDFFEMGRLNIKSLNQSLRLNLNTNLKEMKTDWVDKIWRAFGDKGIVALAFWTGSFFAEQIREQQKSYPFLEVVGEPGSGKTTLIEFLWKLAGRTGYEGFDPSKSSLAGRSRNMAQASNLPVVLLESDRDEDSHARKFDFDELKALYNGRSPRAIGMKTSGTETYEPPFRGSIVISQNATINANDAVLQRVIHLNFFAGRAENRSIAIDIERTDIDAVSGFMLKAIRKEKEILALLAKQTPFYEAQLQQVPEIKNVRICLNHAQMMALVDALALIVPVTPEMTASVHKTITQLAIDRQMRINDDHPKVQQFWELYEYIESRTGKPTLNHRNHGSQTIAVNLNHMMEEALAAKQNVPDLVELKRLLSSSKRYRFIESNKTVSSVLHRNQYDQPRSIKCWIFEKPSTAN